MLILPAEHPLDWKRPPLITLLLIVLNTLIYFAYQGNDPAREEQAVSTYLDAGLLSREKTAFIQSFSAEHELDADQQKALARERQSDLAAMLLQDLRFEQQLHRDPAYLADPAWQAARAPAEAARDSISNFRFGFVPADASALDVPEDEKMVMLEGIYRARLKQQPPADWRELDDELRADKLRAVRAERFRQELSGARPAGRCCGSWPGCCAKCRTWGCGRS